MGSQMASPWSGANGVAKLVALSKIAPQAPSQLGGGFVDTSHASAPFLNSQDRTK